MSSTTSKLRLTDALEATLITGFTAVGSPPVTYPVGTVSAPDGILDPAGKISKGHIVVYPDPGIGGDPSVSDEFELADFIYKIQSVGTTRKQCEWIDDRARSIMLARTASGDYVYAMSPVGGAVVCQRRIVLFGGATSETPGAFTSTSSYEITVS